MNKATACDTRKGNKVHLTDLPEEAAFPHPTLCGQDVSYVFPEERRWQRDHICNHCWRAALREGRPVSHLLEGGKVATKPRGGRPRIDKAGARLVSMSCSLRADQVASLQALAAASGRTRAAHLRDALDSGLTSCESCDKQRLFALLCKVLPDTVKAELADEVLAAVRRALT